MCFQFTYSHCNWENIYIYTLSYYHHQIGNMNYYPLFRVRPWNNGVRCMSFCILTMNTKWYLSRKMDSPEPEIWFLVSMIEDRMDARHSVYWTVIWLANIHHSGGLVKVGHIINVPLLHSCISLLFGYALHDRHSRYSCKTVWNKFEVTKPIYIYCIIIWSILIFTLDIFISWHILTLIWFRLTNAT